MPSKSLLFLALSTLPALAAPVGSSDSDVIDYRRHIMGSLHEQSAALGQILSGVVPDDDVVAQLEAISLTASIALKAFEPRVPGGESKPEVWSNWPDFAKRMTTLADKASEMARIAKEQGARAALEKAGDALECKSCHELYREDE